MAVQIVQYMDLRHTIDINPPTFHYVTYKVSFVTIHFTLLLHGPKRDKTCLRGVSEQQRRGPACPYAQTDQRLCYSHFGKYHI